jgi:N-acylneuraminate cytidylyltransferase
MTPSIVALIPARSGSKRIANKNIKPLGGKPLLAWTIEAALASGIFDLVAVSSDSADYGQIALDHGVAFLRCPAGCGHGDDDPDIRWVEHALGIVRCDAFAILRPTSPFRAPETIKRAWQHFLVNQPCDSLRAVEPVKQHPGKMWVARGNRLLPLLPWEGAGVPWHSSGTQTLPPVWAQNASLEIAWSKTVTKGGTIAGANVLAFQTEGYEGLDINTLEDWERAERLIEEGEICQ